MEGDKSRDGAASVKAANGRRTRRLQAILAADVVGYSRLMTRDEEATLARLQALEAEVVDVQIDAFGGEVVKRMGDGILASFPSAVDALRAALAIQQGVAAHDDTAPGTVPIRYRIGLNVGDVIVADGDIFGDGVNIAARLEGLAEPGGITLSAAVHDSVRAQVAGPFDDLGELRLKNIDRPVRVFRLRPDGDLPHADGGVTVAPRRRVTAVVGLLVAALAAAAWWWGTGDRPPATRPAAALPEPSVVRQEPAPAIAPAPSAGAPAAGGAAGTETRQKEVEPVSSSKKQPSAPKETATGTDIRERLVGTLLDRVVQELEGDSADGKPAKANKNPGKGKGKDKDK